jgi:hypothetical protein
MGHKMIREGVERRRAEKIEAWSAEILTESEVRPFATVDEFMAFLGSLPSPENRPSSPEGDQNR